MERGNLSQKCRTNPEGVVQEKYKSKENCFAIMSAIINTHAELLQGTRRSNFPAKYYSETRDTGDRSDANAFSIFQYSFVASIITRN